MLVLSQYRTSSTYDDLVGERYHFPKRYRSRIEDAPNAFVYYEPRNGGDQAYFGAGWLSNVVEDTEEDGHYYADVSRYQEFLKTVNYYAGPDGKAWEDATQMQWSVRSIDDDRARQLLAAGGLDADAFLATTPPANSNDSPFVDRLQKELEDIKAKAKKAPPSTAVLRKMRVTLERYERPSSITNWVKSSRGSKCQLCGFPGFTKRSGGIYCEVHHLFHLAKFPLDAKLQPEFVVVLCASCHRRMHYASVEDPVPAANGWMVEIDGSPVYFRTSGSSSTQF